MIEPATCTICQEHVSSNAAVTISCGHSFHAECIVSWLRKPRSCASCPNCRHVERLEEYEEQDETTHEISTQNVDESRRPMSDEEVIKIALHEAKLKRSSSGLKQRVETFKKWKKELKSTEKQLSDHMKQYNTRKNKVNKFKTKLCKKAESFVEKIVYVKMKQVGLLDMRKTEDTLKTNRTRERRLYSAAKRNLVRQWQREVTHS